MPHPAGRVLHHPAQCAPDRSGALKNCPAATPPGDRKEVAAHVLNRTDLRGFLGPDQLRNGCSSLFQKVDGNARITEELFRVGNRLVGDAVSNQKHAWLDAPAGGGYRMQKVLLV